jgi:hypothetical protein
MGIAGMCGAVNGLSPSPETDTRDHEFEDTLRATEENCRVACRAVLVAIMDFSEIKRMERWYSAQNQAAMKYAASFLIPTANDAGVGG